MNRLALWVAVTLITAALASPAAVRPVTYCKPLAFDDYRLILTHQVVVIVPYWCQAPARIRKANRNSRNTEPPQTLQPGSITRVWVTTHRIEYTTDGQKWQLLEVRQ